MKSSKNKKDRSQIQQITKKSIVAGGIVGVCLAITGVWIKYQKQTDGIPWILRATLEFNGKLWSVLHSSNKSPPIRSAPPGTKPRVNGDIGLTSPIDLKKWKLSIFLEGSLTQSLSIEDLKWLQRTHTATEFYCIEGWSTTFSYSGIRFSDFLKSYGIDPTQFRYVGLETPDREYYVSIDMESMLHKQTLLADEMNERPLAPENGAPLRLVIPIKYGYKSLKRVGAIRLSNTRPPDYWVEQGYDWFAGL